MFKTIIYLVTAIVLLVAYIRYLENYSIYFPEKNIYFTPEFINLDYEDVYIQTSDFIKINAWFIPCGDAKYTVLFCHGNAGNIGDRLDKISLLNSIGLNTFIIDYRGYGVSKGIPLENGLYLDAKAGYNYLINNRRIKPENIVLFGESLGAAVAINLASEVKVGGLIIEGAFTNVRDMGKRIYPFLPSFVFSNKFDSLKKMKAIIAPKLFIHSKNDEIVPFVLAKKLYDSAGEPRRFVEITGGHNSAFLDSKQIFLSAIKSFVEEL